jgi:hypothetical protein
MTDGTTPPTAPTPVDPVAEARRIMAAQAGGPTSDLATLQKQVKALWAVVIVTLVLTLGFGAFSIFGRALGVGRGNFQPSQFRQQGAGQGVTVPGQ